MSFLYTKTLVVTLTLLFGFGFFGVASAQIIDVVFENEPNALFGETNLLPGKSVSRFIEVSNTGNQPYTAYIRTINTSTTNNLAEALLVQVSEQGEGVVYNGSFQDLFDRDLNSSEALSEVLAGQTKTYDILVTFAADSGNSYQLGTANFDLCVGFDGGNENCISGTGESGGGNGDDDDSNTTTTGFIPNTIEPQVAGVSTDGPFWNNLMDIINGAGEDILRGARGMVLGEGVEAEVATSSEGVSGTKSESDKVEETVKSWLCQYLWVLIVLWLIATAVAFWYQSLRQVFWPIFLTQGVFGAVGLVLSASYFIFGVPCSLWPSLVVVVGSAGVYYLNKFREE